MFRTSLFPVIMLVTGLALLCWRLSSHSLTPETAEALRGARDKSILLIAIGSVVASVGVLGFLRRGA